MYFYQYAVLSLLIQIFDSRTSFPNLLQTEKNPTIVASLINHFRLLLNTIDTLKDSREDRIIQKKPNTIIFNKK